MDMTCGAETAVCTAGVGPVSSGAMGAVKLIAGAKFEGKLVFAGTGLSWSGWGNGTR